jgi:hypothetical protein
MFYLFSGEDPIMFEKASQEAKWKKQRRRRSMLLIRTIHGS